MLKDRIFGVRDPYGNRPLCIGRIVPIRDNKLNGNCPDCNQCEDEADGYVISSESCGFLSIGARYVREVLPGEIVELTRSGVRSVDIVERPNNKPQAFCIFEYVYFARSDSIFEGKPESFPKTKPQINFQVKWFILYECSVGVCWHEKVESTRIL